MGLCLPKKARDAIREALRSGDLPLARLYEMTSEERHAMLKHYVGNDLAGLVNGKFEQAMLSNRKDALAKWVESVTTEQSPIRRDLLKRIGRIEKFLSPDEEAGFLKDLAEQKLGIGVSEEEAGTILKMKSKIDELRAQIPDDSPRGSDERMAYGFAVRLFKNYVGDLKLEASRLSLGERFSPKNWVKDAKDIAGVAKSLLSTLDDSFIGRQGWKVLLSGEYKVWAKSAVQSFKLLGEELTTKSPGLFKRRSSAALDAVYADIYSRPNALNGKYDAARGGYGLGILHEEAFPSSLPERLPFIGRLFKASETAFTGSAERMRADLADAYIATAEQNGVDVMDPEIATGLGRLVSSQTGRAYLGRAESVANDVNVVLFSPRFLVANFNTLTAHALDKEVTGYAQKVAAMNLLKIAISLSATMIVSAVLNPGSVEWDPRSTDFGKIKIAGHRYDITGGMGGMVTLAARIASFHRGEFGSWYKSSDTGAYQKMGTGEFGSRTYVDTLVNFFEGKLAPVPGLLRDIFVGRNYAGQKPDFVNSTIGLITPISAQMLQSEIQKGNDDVLMAMMMETFGFSSSDETFRGFGSKWDKVREKEGDVKYNEALKQVTKRFNERADKLKSTPRWNKMTNQEQADALSRIRTEENNHVFSKYGI